MKKNLLIFLVIVFLIGLFNVAYAQTTLKLSVAAPKATLESTFSRMVAEKVEEKTNGSVKVQVYTDAVLCGQEPAPVQAGIADILSIPIGSLRNLCEWITVGDAHFLVDSGEHFHKVFDSRAEWVTAVNKDLVKHNLLILGAFNLGTRHITANKPLYSPEDLKGLKIRVNPAKNFITMWQTYGANPTPIPIQDLTTALITNQIDAQENPITHIKDYSLYEVQDYVMLTGHRATAVSLLMNNNSFKRLTADQKKAFYDAFDEASWEFDKLTASLLDESRELAEKNGMKFIGEEDGLDIDAFRKKAEDFYVYYAELWGDWVQKIENLR